MIAVLLELMRAQSKLLESACPGIKLYAVKGNIALVTSNGIISDTNTVYVGDFYMLDKNRYLSLIKAEQEVYFSLLEN